MDCNVKNILVYKNIANWKYASFFFFFEYEYESNVPA